MKKVSSLLAAWAALCLLCSLPGAALSQTAQTPPETAETGGWPAEQLGTWVGLHGGRCSQFTFYPNGRYDMTVFEDPSLDQSGTSETLRKAGETALEGGLRRFTDEGEAGAFRRITIPFFRLKAEDETVAPSVDRTLLGTWGGRIGEDYAEWTFRGDGGFTQVTPCEALSEEGFYIASWRELAILLKGKVIQGAFVISQDSLTLDLPGQEGLTLIRKAGHLEQLQLRTEKDMGLDYDDFFYTYRSKKPSGLITRHYFGTQSEVGIFWGGYSPVVGIGDGTFKANKDIQSVTLPEFVMEIGHSAFDGCESLRDVLFIGNRMGSEYAEYYKEVLGFPVIPGSCPLKTIGDAAFRGCVSLENLNLAKSARESTSSQYFTQLGRSDVKGINFPDGLETIGANAFEGCESITSVTFPASVKDIGQDAFKGCPNVTFIVPEGSRAHDYAKSNGIPFVIRGE